jgi:uncharacterized membrane protein
VIARLAEIIFGLTLLLVALGLYLWTQESRGAKWSDVAFAGVFALAGFGFLALAAVR